MTDFTVRFSGRGTRVLRTETVVARDLLSVTARVKRRLGASRSFAQADGFEAGEPRLVPASDRFGVSAAP